MSCTLNIRELSIMQKERVLLEKVNLTLSHKCRISIVGDNGIGKSTLLRAIVGLEKFDGEIEFFHQKIDSESKFKQVRQKVGFLFQNPDEQFVTMSVLDELIFGLINIGVDYNIAKERAFNKLQEFDILHLSEKIPFYLSGGEKKLIALLSILILEPEILLLDEPTNYLDKKSEFLIKNILKNTDKSMIITSHDSNFVSEISTSVFKLTQNALIRLY